MEVFTCSYSSLEISTENLYNILIPFLVFSCNFRTFLCINVLKGQEIMWLHVTLRVTYISCLGEVTILQSSSNCSWSCGPSSYSYHESSAVFFTCAKLFYMKVQTIMVPHSYLRSGFTEIRAPFLGSICGQGDYLRQPCLVRETIVEATLGPGGPIMGGPSMAWQSIWSVDAITCNLDCSRVK